MYELRWFARQIVWKINWKVPFPLFGVTHGLQVFLNFEDFLLFVGRYLEPINGLKEINLFIQSFLEGLFPLLFSEGLVVLDFLEFSDSPHLWSIKKLLKVLGTKFRNLFEFWDFFFFQFIICGAVLLSYGIRFIVRAQVGTVSVFDFLTSWQVFLQTILGSSAEWTARLSFYVLTTFNCRNTCWARLFYLYACQ